MSPFESAYVVPVAGTIMILGIVVASKAQEYGVRKLQYEERMTAIAKGLTLPEPPVPVREVTRINLRLRMANVRRAGIVLVAAGIGIALFFAILAWVVQERDVLSGMAAAFIPFAIGVGLLIDAKLQSGEIRDDQTAPDSYLKS